MAPSVRTKKSLTVTEEGFLHVQRFDAVLTHSGRRGTDWDEDVTVCTLLFSVLTLSFLLSSPLLLLLLEAIKQ